MSNIIKLINKNKFCLIFTIVIIAVGLYGCAGKASLQSKEMLEKYFSACISHNNKIIKKTSVIYIFPFLSEWKILSEEDIIIEEKNFSEMTDYFRKARILEQKIKKANTALHKINIGTKIAEVQEDRINELLSSRDSIIKSIIPRKCIKIDIEKTVLSWRETIPISFHGYTLKQNAEKFDLYNILSCITEDESDKYLQQDETDIVVDTLTPNAVESINKLGKLLIPKTEMYKMAEEEACSDGKIYSIDVLNRALFELNNKLNKYKYDKACITNSLKHCQINIYLLFKQFSKDNILFQLWDESELRFVRLFSKTFEDSIEKRELKGKYKLMTKTYYCLLHILEGNEIVLKRYMLRLVNIDTKRKRSGWKIWDARPIDS